MLTTTAVTPASVKMYYKRHGSGSEERAEGFIKREEKKKRERRQEVCPFFNQYYKFGNPCYNVTDLGSPKQRDRITTSLQTLYKKTQPVFSSMSDVKSDKTSLFFF